MTIDIEAITVILIVAPIIILALTKIKTSEGTVGILSSIVGYVLDNETSEKVEMLIKKFSGRDEGVSTNSDQN